MPKAAQNPYEVLNVSPAAQPVVIEAAYRALMKRYHPDHARTAGDAAAAVAINEAYAVLRNPERRADYDRRTEGERRERAAQQHARLVALGGPAERPRANLFGWSGWLVAAAACGVLATVPRGGVAPSSSGAAASTRAGIAAATEPAPSSQPAIPEVSTAEFDRIAVADPPPPPAALAGPVSIAPAPSAARPAAPSPRASRPRASAGSARARTRPRESRSPDAEFLAREDYIY